MTLLLTAGPECPNGQGSHRPGSRPHSAPPAAVGDVGLVPFPLWDPGPTGPDVHWAVGMQSACEEAKGIVSWALLSYGVDRP